jgi:hypothetical protein
MLPLITLLPPKLNGDSCCSPETQLARCATRRCLTAGSTPSMRPMYRLTSVAHSLKPVLNLCSTVGSVATATANCWRCMFCRCFTVISRISAFSNLECRAGCNSPYKTALFACEVGKGYCRNTEVSKHDCCANLRASLAFTVLVSPNRKGC